MPPATRTIYLDAFTGALSTVFVVAAAVAVLGFALAWLLEERPLRETVAADAKSVGELYSPPCDDDPLTQIARGLTALSRRDVQRRLIEHAAARAGVDLPALECWMLARLHEDPAIAAATLATRAAVPPTRVAGALATLRARGLVAAPLDAADASRPLTPAGNAIYDRLVAARIAALREMLAGWAPERHADLAEFMRRLANEDIGTAPT